MVSNEKPRCGICRILTAHNREMNAIAAQKTAEAHEAFVKNAELAEAIAAKDAEIEKLKNENARLRVIVSGATVADGDLREEIVRLREIVKELADALGSEARVKCALCDTRRRFKGCHEIKGFCSVYDINTLVAKAREVVK